ncbi:MAG TPA: NAD(P)/FAD-dependent oxidoreductase [Acidimicrobiales bacterium]
MDTTWDCIVVGGGAAGLSAALVLGRARRRTLLVDAGGQSNRIAAGIGGLLGHDGRPPTGLYTAGRAELAAYPTVEVRDAAVRSGERRGDGFALDLVDPGPAVTRRVLLATGMDYRYPPLPGIPPRWGHSVFHCPFCHGWEVRGRPLGVLGGDAMAAQRALLLRMWSDDVTLFAGGPADLATGDAERLAAAGVAVEERPVAGLRGPEPGLDAVVLGDGTERACAGLLVPVTLHQRSDLAARLGAALAPAGLAADAITVGPTSETSVPGLYAAGDLTGTMPSVANAVAVAAGAAAAVVHSLAEDLAGRAPAAA